MDVYLISDTHFNHANIVTYCQRPKNFTELILKRWAETVKPEDLVIHLGDVILHKAAIIKEILDSLPGRKGLILGNHDRKHSCTWWMEHGFDFACNGMKFRNCWLTHEPSASLADGCELNLHGHLHNIWDGFTPDGPPKCTCTEPVLERDKHDRHCPTNVQAVERRLRNPWQRLFAIEYTDYRPVEFDKFVAHPDKWQARGPK